MQTARLSPGLLARASAVALALCWVASCGAKEEAPYVAPYRTSSCGNGVREDKEPCDGTDLGGETCATLTLNARPRGQLRCSALCAIDQSACETALASGSGGTGSGTGGGPGTGGTGGGP